MRRAPASLLFHRGHGRDHWDLVLATGTRCLTIGFDRDKMAHFRQQGVEPWFYGPMIYEREANSACGSNTFLDLDLLTGRGVGWATWKYQCGYCEWEFDAYFDAINDQRDPELNWTNALNFRKGEIAFNGSGLLIYRGSFIGSPDAISYDQSRRLRFDVHIAGSRLEGLQENLVHQTND